MGRISEQTGKRNTDAILLLNGLSSDLFRLSEYDNDIVVYYGDTGRINTYLRQDKVRRIK